MIIAKEYLGRSRLFSAPEEWTSRKLVELYAACLVKDGLARQGTWRCLSLVADLLSWIASTAERKLRLRLA